MKFILRSTDEYDKTRQVFRREQAGIRRRRGSGYGYSQMLEDIPGGGGMTSSISRQITGTAKILLLRDAFWRCERVNTS